jgi:hypothetical protein
MTRPATAPPTQATNTGPKPVTVDDLIMTIGQMQVQIQVLQRENAHLKERLAAVGAPPAEGEA